MARFSAYLEAGNKALLRCREFFRVKQGQLSQVWNKQITYDMRRPDAEPDTYQSTARWRITWVKIMMIVEYFCLFKNLGEETTGYLYFLPEELSNSIEVIADRLQATARRHNISFNRCAQQTIRNGSETLVALAISRDDYSWKASLAGRGEKVKSIVATLDEEGNRCLKAIDDLDGYRDRETLLALKALIDAKLSSTA